MAVNLFGFEIKRSPQIQAKDDIKSVSPLQDDSGAINITASGGSSATFLDLNGIIRSETELVTRYREMIIVPEVDQAVEDIITEAICNKDQEKIVEIALDDIKILKPQQKQIIADEFRNVLKLLEFNKYAYDIFKRWYVDGRIYYHVIIDPAAPQNGIQALRFIDPRKIRKVREINQTTDPRTGAVVNQTINEYYLYNDKTFDNSVIGGAKLGTSGIRIAKDSIIYITSGLMDTGYQMVLSFLHKAIKPLNMLRSIEDSTIIYLLSRAADRRIFYIDVGDLPPAKADQYLRDMMVKHKNKLQYDSMNGTVSDQRRFTTMVEDYWFPRRGANRSTEVETLPGGQIIGSNDNILYFQQKLFRSLNVPITRLDPSQGFSLGHAGEISRDEVKFSKFIDRLRMRFSDLFTKTLEEQLLLKGIVNDIEWEYIKNDIKYIFAEDNHWAELKDNQILSERINVVTQVQPLIGSFFSASWIRRNILRQTEEQIEEMDEEIAAEFNDPQFAVFYQLNQQALLGEEEDQMQQAQLQAGQVPNDQEQQDDQEHSDKKNVDSYSAD